MDDIEAELNIPEDETTIYELIEKPIHLHKGPEYKGRSRETGFHKSSRLCLKIIRDALLHHNWQEAAEYFISYIQTLEDTTVKRAALASEIIWRLGIEILHHLPNANSDDFSSVYEQMKSSGLKNYAKICLEKTFHHLLNGQFDDARRQLTVASSWKYGQLSEAQSLETELICAYCGLLDYIIWSDMKETTSGTEDDGTSGDFHNYFKKASVTLQKIIKQPGIWDPFVLSYIAMLEFYNNENEALTVLQNYAYNKKFPSNPNAHVYLYQFLKRHKAPQAELISSLRILHSLVPSHELMLEFCSLLMRTGQQRDLQEALSVIMDLLEFSSWKSERKAWKCLWKIMQTLKKIKCRDVVSTEWGNRKSLWLDMHFRTYIGRTELVNKVKLLKLKAKVLWFADQQRRDYHKMAVIAKKKKKKKTSKHQPKKTKSKSLK